METVGVEPTPPSLQARRSSGLSYIPRVRVRTGGVEPPQREAAGLRPAELTGAQRPQRKGGRPEWNRCREDHDLECCRYTTATTKKVGTTGLEPAASRLTSERSSAELRPRGHAWRGWDSNPRSRAHEAREDSRSSTALGLVGRSRTCGLRLPKPAGWPRSPTTSRVMSTPGGTRTRSFRVEGPASSPVRPRGREAPAAAFEPACRE